LVTVHLDHSEIAIGQCVREILNACPAGTSVILFGSRARRDHRKTSDVDLMVIEPEVPSRITEAARLARVIRHLRLPLDLIVVSHADFEAWKDVPGSVFHEAAREGQVLA
jgi:predicted nucleotidyltransferase